MTIWLLPAIALALVVAWVWWRERQPKKAGGSFRPWYVRLKPRGRK